jgi:lipopolysaccharide transport system permease protein
MLALYTFVFGIVFGGRRWDGASQSSIGEFAIILFAGLIPHAVFAEMLGLCPKLIRSNPNYVKKMVFPLEVLPIAALGGVLFHATISFTMLLVVQLLLIGRLPFTFLLLPVVLAPFALMVLGISWFLTSLGVFVRDIDQVLRPLTAVLLFVSPIFYPIDRIAEPYRALLYLNPLTFIVEQMRAVLIWGQMPNWFGLAVYGIIAMIVAALGLWWFQKTRRGFADVL